jgi:tetratricopeptide (TPR) repeat protein
MRLEDWDEAIHSFSRCVQQDSEIGEAWANMGAIYMRMRYFEKAFHSLNEALKQKRDSWKILENLVGTCLALGKWRQVISHMNSLLDLRLKSQQPVLKDELRHLVFIVSSIIQKDAQRAANISSSPSKGEEKHDTSEKNDDEDDDPIIIHVIQLPELGKALESLLSRITSTIHSDADIWDIVASFYYKLGQRQQVLDSRLKQFRSLMNIPGWEKEEGSVSKTIDCAELLIKSFFSFIAPNPVSSSALSSKTEHYNCLSLIKICWRGVSTNFDGTSYSQRIQLCQEKILAIAV